MTIAEREDLPPMPTRPAHDQPARPTARPAGRARRTSYDDSADATALLRIGAPLACPTCGTHTRPADSRQGWVCLNADCIFAQ